MQPKKYWKALRWCETPKYQLQEFENNANLQEKNFNLMAMRVKHNLNSRLDYLASEELML